MTDYLIACRPGSYGKYREEAFRHLPQIGIRHVELNAPPKEDWNGLKAELSDHGLAASSIGGSVDLSKPDFVSRFTHLANTARAFDARIIFLSAKSGGLSEEKVYARLRQLGDIARVHEATIAIETHPDLATNGDVATRTMEGTCHPAVKLNYDSANIYFYNEGVDGIAELKKFLPWLASVHLKETNGQYKTWYFPGLHEGDGIVDFKEIFRICGEISFKGPFTLEIEGIKGEALSRDGALQRMANSVKYLKSIEVM
jgi:sugar phosphate isomerase/epimerase